MTLKTRLLIAVTAALAASGIARAAHNINCNDPYETDVSAIFYNVDNEYDDFKDFIEDHTGVNLQSCFENRFKDNGDVRCTNLSTGLIGYSIPGDDHIKIDTGWLGGLPQSTDADQKFRRACIVGTMAHEFAHSCFSTEARAELIDDAAFGWWQQRFDATGYFSNCPQN